MKIPRKLARKLAKMAAQAGLPLREFVERALTLATEESRDRAVFLSMNYGDMPAYNRLICAEIKAANVGWTLKENQ